MRNIAPQTVQKEVLTHSQQWIQDFNQGNAEGCIAAYTADAVMRAIPMGTFQGIDAIAGFWKPFMASGAQNLEYHDVKIKIVNDSTVHLSASWSMNVGRGIITKEKWGKQAGGNWQLEEDDFEVLEQFHTT